MFCGASVHVGPYRILSVLASREHGRVYVAESRSGQRVVLKEIAFATVPGAEALDRFEREARILAQLAHPRIPRFHSYFREGQGVEMRLYLAQEYVEGRSLEARLGHRRITESEALDIARQVLEVLEYLHGLSPRVIHRDIKPSNLVMTDTGAVHLVDFGIARDLSAQSTAGATLAGTFDYMPPEQLGGTVDVSSDLYALGATLIHLLTGRLPSEMLDHTLRLRFEAQVLGSPRLRRLLEGLTARLPRDRFPSALDALLALEAPAEPAPGGLSVRSALGVVALGLAAVAVGGLWPRDGEDPPTPPLAAPANAGAAASAKAREATPVHMDEVPGAAQRDPTWEPTPAPLEGDPPLARWRFDEQPGTPTFRDDGLRFDVEGALERTQGLHGGGLWCNGVSAPGQVVAAEGTFSAWVRREDPKSGGWLLARGVEGRHDVVDPGVLVQGDGRVLLSAGTARNLLSSRTLSSGVFHHLVATWGPHGKRLFVDGRLEASSAEDSRVVASLLPVLVARSPLYPAQGECLLTLDDVSFYDRALAGPEIARLYAGHAGVPGTVTGPPLRVALLEEPFEIFPGRWRFPEGTDPKRAGITQRQSPRGMVVHLSRSSVDGGIAPLAWWIPEQRHVSHGKDLWLEFDVSLEKCDFAPRLPDQDNAAGVGVRVYVHTSRQTEKLPITVLACSQAPGLQHWGHRLVQPVPFAAWTHVRVELNSLLQQHVGRVTTVAEVDLVAAGADVVGAVDNVAVTSE